LNTYQLEWNGFTRNIVAKTASKAKYEYWSTVINDCYDISFGGFLKRATCKLLNKFHYKDLFIQDIEDFKETLVRRGIEFAHLGMKVEVAGRPGRIVGCNASLNLDVCFEGETWKNNCHPHWRIKYFDNQDKVVAEYSN
jgi:hypothetical protein